MPARVCVCVCVCFVYVWNISFSFFSINRFVCFYVSCAYFSQWVCVCMRCVCVHFFAHGLLFKLNEKNTRTQHTHSNSKLNDTNSDSFHGQWAFFCTVFLLLLLKNSFMIYDLLSIEFELVSVCVRTMFRFIAFFIGDIWSLFFVQFSRAMGHKHTHCTHKIFNNRYFKGHSNE